jgi:hypothetical protein
MLFAGLSLSGCEGGEQGPGRLEGPRRPAVDVARDDARRAESARRLATRAQLRESQPGKQILFGDLHVHSSFSVDAFMMELPVTGLQGAHPPADACDFARYCANLDFFSFNDHATTLTPEHWQMTKDVVRQCDGLAGGPEDKDLLVFAGWEWTHVGKTPEDHWGHKNVIFPGLADDELPARPISARADDGDLGIFRNFLGRARARFVDPLNWNYYLDLEWLLTKVIGTPMCPQDVHSRALPPDCHENAATPGVLYRKLDEWGFDSIVIPHGNAWGVHTPPATSWDKALQRENFDPDRQILLEVMSGHGNSEEYRDYRAIEWHENGEAVCSEPTADFLPCCWRAGEIMRERCGDLPAEECEQRVRLARQYAANAGVIPFQVFPDAPIEEWLDCDQCRDCAKPAYNYRPGGSSQYAMAISNFDDAGPDGRPLRFRYGFLASTDDHTSRPGTGYKQYQRRNMTMATGAARDWLIEKPGTMADPRLPQEVDLSGMITPEGVRLGSFTYPGGIVAAHADSRSRKSVWAALKRREVYGTSGPRMLLWFDLLNGSEGRAPMGSEHVLTENPRFEVRAAGAFEQQPGCPEASHQALSAERLEALCMGECRNPGDVRHRIEAIEVVRIRPQRERGEPVAPLIEDPWRRFECEPDPDGCVVRFEDPEWKTSARDALYYVRALQEPTPAINGDALRTSFDAEGNPISVDICYGDVRTPLDDDCLAPSRERAWSSPIFVDQRSGA